MKKIFYVVVLCLAVAACKNSEGDKTDGEEDIQSSVDGDSSAVYDPNMPIYSGEFIYTEEGAVLNGKDFIYGVVMDDMAKELADRVEPVKRDQFDMVNVVVQGVVSPNPAIEEGKEAWEEVIEIKFIVNVAKAPSKPDVQIKSQE